MTVGAVGDGGGGVAWHAKEGGAHVWDAHHGVSVEGHHVHVLEAEAAGGPAGKMVVVGEGEVAVGIGVGAGGGDVRGV